jgi:diacylglycerol kinase (ATP)
MTADAPSSSRVLVVFNPKSGRGRAARRVPPLCAALKARGLLPVQHPISTPLPTPAELRGARALVAIGGDGTVAALCELARQSGVPLYHSPTGTENLFARDLRMSADPIRTAACITAGQTRALDLIQSTSNGTTRPVVLMLSVGPDAGVVARLTRARTGAITKLSYVRHILAELGRPTLPTIEVEVDGAPLASGRGMVIVANCGRYGGGFDPAGEAKMDDGLLDVAFFPMTSGFDWLASMLWCKAGRRASLKGVATARGRTARIRLPEGGAVQTDGEHESDGPTPREYTLETLPGVFPVIAPPNAP